MPVDSGHKGGKSKGSGHPAVRQHSRGSMAASRYDSDTDSPLPAVFRSRLHHLFTQIEKEFETVYSENLLLQDKVEALQERLDSGDKSVETADVADGAVKTKRYAASHISQKIKKSYIASTSKLVSSFRQASPAYSVVKKFHGHKDGIWEVSVSPLDRQVIGTASADHTARIWSTLSGRCLQQYTGHQGSVNAVRFHPTQDLVVTTGGDGTAHIWCPQVGARTHEVMKSHSSGEDDLEMSEKEEMEEVPEQAVGAILRNPSRELIGHNGVVIAADWLFSGSQVITASWDRTAILFDAETGEQVSSLTGHDQELTEVRAHPSQNLVVTSSKDATFRLWDFRETNMPVTVFQGHTQTVTTALFTHHEKVVSGSDDRTVKVWDLKNMRSPIATIRTDSSVNRLAVSPSQSVIAIPHDNRQIRLYDINGNRLGRLPRSNRTGHSKMVCSVAWAEDVPVCNMVSCGFDRQVLGWHINMQIKE